MEASRQPGRDVGPPLSGAAGSSKGSPRGTAPPRSGSSNSFRAAEEAAAEGSEEALACPWLPAGCRVERVWPNLLPQPAEREQYCHFGLQGRLRKHQRNGATWGKRQALTGACSPGPASLHAGPEPPDGTPPGFKSSRPPHCFQEETASSVHTPGSPWPRPVGPLSSAPRAAPQSSYKRSRSANHRPGAASCGMQW